MAFTQADVFREAAVITNDDAFSRWTLPKLNQFLNAGIDDIALYKPNAVEVTKTMPMVEGVYQELTPPDFALIRVLRNADGAVVTEIKREIMDSMVPGWADPDIYPFAAAVQHTITDAAEPDSFRVFPGNTGSGHLIVVVATKPAHLADGADPLNINTFDAVVPLSDIYRQSLVNYVISKCFTVDSEAPGSAARAQAHYALFANALGIKFTMETTANPKTTHVQNTQGAEG